MANNKAQIEISAVDKTAAAFSAIQSKMRGMETAAAGLNGVMARLAPLVGAATFTAFTKNIIDSADAMNDMSVRTGVAVERLSAWRLATETSGTDLEALAGALGKTSKYMVEHGDNLQKLGINAKTAEGVILQLSDVIASLPADDPRRVALAMEVMGKSAASLLPLLSQGSEELGKWLKHGEELGAVNKDLAKNADAFNDQLGIMKEQFSAGGGALVNDLLPPLVKFMQLITGTRSPSDLGADLFQELLDTNQKINKLKSDQKGAFGFLVRDEDIARLDRYAKQVQEKLTKANDEAAKLREKSAATAGKAVDPSTIDSVIKTGGDSGKKKAAKDSYDDLIRQQSEMDFAQMEMIAKYREKVQKEKEDAFADLEKRAQDSMNQAGDDKLEKLEEKARKQAAVWEETRTPLEKYIAKVDELNSLGLDGDTLERALKKAGEEFDSIADKAKDTKDFAKDIGLTFSSAFEDAVVGGKKFSEVLQSLAQDIEKLILRKTITEPITSGISKWFDEGGSSGIGDFFSNIFGGMPSYAVGTDYVPRDMVAQIHKGERIIPAAQNKAGFGDGVAITINNTMANQADVQAKPRMNDGKLEIEILVQQIMNRDIRNNGPMTQQLGQAFGLGRVV